LLSAPLGAIDFLCLALGRYRSRHQGYYERDLGLAAFWLPRGSDDRHAARRQRGSSEHLAHWYQDGGDFENAIDTSGTYNGLIAAKATYNAVDANWYELIDYQNDAFGVVTSGSAKKSTHATLKSMIAANPVEGLRQCAERALNH
jgi:hypothetical protein